MNLAELQADMTKMGKETLAALNVVTAALPELLRRGTIPAQRDGFGSRASNTEATAGPGHTTWLTDGSWSCLCGAHGPEGMSDEAAAAGRHDHEETVAHRVGHTDSVGQLATSGGRLQDPVAATARRAMRDMRDLHDRALRLKDAMGEVGGLIEVTRQGKGDPAPEGWCQSCWRDDRHHEPITLRGNGQPYYAGLCRWCGAFMADHPVKGASRSDARSWPPLVLIVMRHEGRRISQADVDEALAKRGQQAKR